MSAEEIWHTQMEAVRRGGWDTMSGYFALDADAAGHDIPRAGRDRRVPAERVRRRGRAEEADMRNEFATDEWGAFEYTSRGVIDAERAAQFAERIGVAGHGAGDLAGRRFEIPVCFIYHVSAKGLIDRVTEYAAIAGLPA